MTVMKGAVAGAASRGAMTSVKGDSEEAGTPSRMP